MSAAKLRVWKNRLDGLLRRPTALMLVATTILAGYFYCSALRYHNYPYGGGDGEFYSVMIRQMFAWSEPGRAAGVNPYQGMGTVYLPLNPWINPGYRLLNIIDNSVLARVVSSVWFTLELFASVALLGRAFRLAWPSAIVVGQFCCVAAFVNPWRLFGIFCQFDLNPGVAHWVALGNLMLAMLMQVDSERQRRSLIFGAALPFVWLYAVACDPFFTAVVFAPVFFFAGVVVICANSWRSFCWRLGAAAWFAFVNWTVGMHDYYRAASGNLARQMFRGEIYGELQVREYASLVFQNNATRLLFTALLTSLVALFVLGRSREKRFALLTGLYLLGMTALGAAFLRLGINWTYPLPVYLEYGAYSVYAVVGMLGMVRLADAAATSHAARRAVDAGRRTLAYAPQLAAGARRVASWIDFRLVARYGLVCGFPLAAGVGMLTATKLPLSARRLAALEISGKQGKPATAIIDCLKSEIAVAPGREFRGSVVSLYARNGSPIDRRRGIAAEAPYHVLRLQDAMNVVAAQFGNTHYWMDLWRESIPTLEEYGQMVSPTMYYLMSRTMSRPQDHTSRNFLPDVTNADYELLAALGVRFAVTDDDWSARPGFRLREEVIAKDGLSLRLYEFPTTNRGDYSPVRTHVRATAADAVALLNAPGFDYRQEVVLHAPLEDLPTDLPLAPARGGRMRFDRGSIHVAAESDGASLLLLPLQYSNCLTVRNLSAGRRDSGDVRLLRANVAQTAILFRGSLDVDLVFQFGLNDNVAARLADLEDARRLELATQQLPKLPRGFHPHAAYTTPQYR